ncbi:putative DNA-directed RNA polymerase III subunit Rpc34 [Talaromyces proteolyticus]|uniref:DNA-directed RNA polymerase III subunit RPC6 n=1 Tax=Talaromyces proteolyticus TaxID=1131652 RepID=A0AAD4KST7_9EURO|nr:putative DNA-directed RNA polymerase III subunit Rpc34 [Talaromyces proteolyticus]KAH8695936.1 putative DNA-directed RNA polymerase III subunit Rpc34 [Talaromyces proteolyticus]
MAAAGNVEDIASQIYAKCRDQFSASQLLYQRDILGLGLVPNKSLEILLQCTQHLVDQNLFRVYQDGDNRLAWKVIAREDAEKIQSLNDNERLVYNAIHSTGRNGIWIRALGKRTDLHKSSLDKALKALEGKNFIKSIHNVKQPGKKVYMLAGLKPAEDVTGGAWFTDGVLDAEFIGVLSEYIEDWVSKRSWYEVPSPRNNSKRQKLNHGENTKTEIEKTYFPYPADYQYYPKAQDITAEVNKTGITPVRLDEGSIEQLLRMMCFDGRLIALNDYQNYKSMRRPDAVAEARSMASKTDRPLETQQKAWLGNNGMTEAPCGQCPVFRLCQPGGSVSPENCEYFDEWFKKAFTF